MAKNPMQMSQEEFDRAQSRLGVKPVETQNKTRRVAGGKTKADLLREEQEAIKVRIMRDTVERLGGKGKNKRDRN